MASSLIGQLRVTLGLETASFETGTRKAKKELGDLGKAAEEVRGLVGSMIAAASIEMMGELVKRSLEHVAALGEQAKALGITTRELQEYRYVAGQTGMTVEQTDKFLGKLSKSMGDARNGADSQKKAFSALSQVLGVDILKSAKGVGDAIPLISDALKKIEDPTRRNSLEAAILGKSWRDAGALLALGSEGINKLRDAAEELGVVLSDDQIQNAEETAHKLKALHDVLEARIDAAVAANARAIYDLANALLNVALATIRFINANPAKAAGLLGMLAGAAVGGKTGAVVGGIIGAYEAEEQKPESIRARLHADQYNFRSYYLQHGGTQDELDGIGRGGKLNPQVVARMRQHSGYYDYRNKIIQDVHDLRDATAPPVAANEGGGTAAPPKFLGGGRSHHPHDDSNERARDNERRQYDIDRQTIEDKQQLLEAQRNLTVDTEDRNNLSLNLLQLEHDQHALEIRHQLAEVELDKKTSDATKEAARVRAQQALSLNDQLLVIRSQGANLQAELQRQQEFEATERATYQAKEDRLQLEADLAQTTAERRKVELELLDLQYQERRETLQRILDEKYLGQYTHTQDERARAQIELDALKSTYPLARSKVMESTAGPLDQLRRAIPDTAAKMNEALEEVAAKGLQDLTDGLAEASASWIKLGGVAGNILREIYTGVMKILLARYVEKPLANGLGKLLDSLGGLSSGGGGISKGTGMEGTGALKGFASGGSFMIGGMAGIDHNLLQVNGHPIARVSRDERLTITPANDTGGGGGSYYDMRGAFLTKELFDYIESGDNRATVQGGALGSAGAMTTLRRRAARQIPTGGRR